LTELAVAGKLVAMFTATLTASTSSPSFRSVSRLVATRTTDGLLLRTIGVTPELVSVVLVIGGCGPG
jgi:hypothetical protein